MAKQRQNGAKAALGQQGAQLKRNAHGKRFVGDDGGAHQAREAERAKVHQMQLAARDAAQRAAKRQEARRAHEALVHRPLWEGVAGLALQSARLATTVLALPLRAARLPFRLAASVLPRWGHA
jgi:hypothetical protein